MPSQLLKTCRSELAKLTTEPVNPKHKTGQYNLFSVIDSVSHAKTGKKAMCEGEHLLKAVHKGQLFVKNCSAVPKQSKEIHTGILVVKKQITKIEEKCNTWK